MKNVPDEMIHEINVVLSQGAEKHGADSYKTRSYVQDYQKLLQHAQAWEHGVKREDESHCHSMAHVIARAILIWKRDLETEVAK